MKLYRDQRAHLMYLSYFIFLLVLFSCSKENPRDAEKQIQDEKLALRSSDDCEATINILSPTALCQGGLTGYRTPLTIEMVITGLSGPEDGWCLGCMYISWGDGTSNLYGDCGSTFVFNHQGSYTHSYSNLPPNTCNTYTITMGYTAVNEDVCTLCNQEKSAFTATTSIIVCNCK